MDDNTILDDNLSTNPTNLVSASLNKRFFNHLIDSIAIMVPYFGIGLSLNSGFLDKGSGGYFDFTYMAIVLAYYFAMESMTNGKTIGKFVTNTRVVGIDGFQPEAKSYFIRTIVRLVPFEAISIFIHNPIGWHDKWSETLVIDEEKSTVPN